MTTLPAGIYYIGDLCYCMHTSWDEICDIFLRNNTLAEGLHTLKDGRVFAIFPTLYGDGTYWDQCGGEYSVDAGVIGCIRLEDMDPDADPAYWGRLGQVVKFSAPFTVSRVGGRLTFGHIHIDTE